MLKKYIKLFVHDVQNSFKDILPIVVVIAIFQIFIIQEFPDNVDSIILGLIIIVFGLALFMNGLEIGIFPIGEKLALDFSKQKSKFWLFVFAFTIGFSTTIAEPALIVISEKANLISSGLIDPLWLRITVAFSVGLAIFIGVFRIIYGYPIQYFIIAGYSLIIIITFFSPKEIVGLAYDSGGVTTSTVTVPLIAALGIGLASNIKGRNPLIDGFGLIAFASLMPIIFVQMYGIIVYNFMSPEIVNLNENVVKIAHETIELGYSFLTILSNFVSVVIDVAPVFIIIFFFQYIIIKKKVENIKDIFVGIIFVILGLYAFILGLEIGLFPIGESIAKQLTEINNNMYIYTFAFLIGFSTTMAEPALLAIAKQVEKITNGDIKQVILRAIVAIGVAVGLALGSYRIIVGDSIANYIMVGYIIVVILTYFTPKYIIAIAYDSGGVTTSTVTVPLVAALGIGLASNIEGRSPLIDGFGLIAFASLFPIISVMIYSIIVSKLKKNK